MLIIDHHSEQKLSKYLHESWFAPESFKVRYLYFPIDQWKPAGVETSEIHAKIVMLAATHLSTGDAQLYVLSHGDALLVANPLPRAEAHGLMVALAEAYHQMADERFAEYQEVRHGGRRLIAMLEDRQLERDRLEAIAKERLAAQRKAERRTKILAFNPSNPGEIAVRRKGRDHAELMIIEDDPFSARLVENTLSRQYPITTLNTAEYALQTYAEKAPDMLLLDINLPEVNGHELLENILRIDPNAYVVMLSANSDLENVRRAMQHGAKGFVTKPFSHDKLMRYVENCPTLQH